MSHCRKNSVRDKVIRSEFIYLEMHVPQTECSPSQKARMALGEITPQTVWAISEGERPQIMGQLAFMGWVISQANELVNYFNYNIQGKSGDFQELGHHPLFDFYGESQNCHGVCGCIIQHAYV